MTLSMKNWKSRSLQFQTLSAREMMAADLSGINTDVVAIKDLNQDGTSEIAVIYTDPATGLQQWSIRDIISGETISTAAASATIQNVDIESFEDAQGETKIAWLAERLSDGSSTIQIRDAQTLRRDAILTGLTADYKVIDLEIAQTDSDGAIAAILAYAPSTGQTRIKVMELETGKRLSTFGIGFNAIPIDMTVVDLGNGDFRLAILEQVEIRGEWNHRIQVRTLDGTRTSIRSLGRISDTLTQDTATNRFADRILVSENSQIFVVHKDAMDETHELQRYTSDLHFIDSIEFDSNLHAVAVSSMTQSSPTSATISVLLKNRQTNASIVGTFDVDQLQPLSHSLGSWSHHGNGFSSDTLTMVTVENEHGPAVILSQSSDVYNQSRLRIANTVTGRHVQTIPLTWTSHREQDWYSENRMQLHTRLGPVHPNPENPGFFDIPESFSAGEAVSQLGARVLTRHVNARDEDPWWPSFYPANPDNPYQSIYVEARENMGVQVEANRNIPQEYFDELLSNDVQPIAYYWISSEQSLAEQNPDWVCRSPSGQPIDHGRRGIYLDLASEYQQIVFGRLDELAAMGASAFYFDSYHLPAEGCWGGEFERLFSANTGLTAPTNANHQNYQAWIDFKADYLADFFEALASHLHRQFPHVKLLISDPPLPGLFERQTSSRQSAPDLVKTEYRFAIRFDGGFYGSNPSVYQPLDEYRQALGWTILRASSYDQMPHVWMAGFSSPEQIRTFVASLFTYQAVANIDIPEANILIANNPSGTTTRETIQAGVDFGVILNDALKGTKADKAIGLLFSESQRNDRTSIGEAYDDVIAPVTGAFQAAKELHLPVDLILDHQLQDPEVDLSNFRLVFVTDRQQLPLASQMRLSDFEVLGGTVIEIDNSFDWRSETGYRYAVDTLKEAIGNIVDSKIQMVSSHTNIHTQVFYTPSNDLDQRLLIANSFGHVRSIRSLGNAGPLPPPAPVQGLTINLLPPLPDVEPVIFDLVNDSEIVATRGISHFQVTIPDFQEGIALSIRWVSSGSQSATVVASPSVIAQPQLQFAYCHDDDYDNNLHVPVSTPKFSGEQSDNDSYFSALEDSSAAAPDDLEQDGAIMASVAPDSTASVDIAFALIHLLDAL